MTEQMLLPPDHPQAPKYWMHETGGKLVPAMNRYLKGEDSVPGDIDLIRSYLLQWIDSPVWDGGAEAEAGALHDLRIKVHELNNRNQIDMWLELASHLAIDPL